MGLDGAEREGGQAAAIIAVDAKGCGRSSGCCGKAVLRAHCCQRHIIVRVELRAFPHQIILRGRLCAHSTGSLYADHTHSCSHVEEFAVACAIWDTDLFSQQGSWWDELVSTMDMRLLNNYPTQCISRLSRKVAFSSRFNGKCQHPFCSALHGVSEEVYINEHLPIGTQYGTDHTNDNRVYLPTRHTMWDRSH